MKKILLFLIFTSITNSSLAGFLMQDSQQCGRYVSGKELADNNKDLVKFENGFFVDVPKNYNNPTGEKTQVYAFFADKFDPEKPTYVFFLGGPGQNAHQHLSFKFNFYRTLGYNFLLLDQRGISFSRFDNIDAARNIENYSSESTARDMLSVIDFLELKKVSVYGASYGTIPATIFGSLFPERTTSVILEGVVYDGDKAIFQDMYRAKIIQNYFSSLPIELKSRIQSLIENKQMTPYQLPGTLMAILMMYGQDMLSFYTKVLNLALVERQGSTQVDLAKAWGDLSTQLFPAKKSYSIDAPKMSDDKCFKIEDSNDVNQILMIKEFGAAEKTTFTTFALNNGKIEAVPNSGYKKSEAYINWPEKLSFYSAKNYPVKVPLFYLQGTYDGATPSPGAVYHFKNTPQDKSQLFLFAGSPHMPTGKIINDMNDLEIEWKPLQQLFKSLLDGIPVSCQTVDQINKFYPTARMSSAGKNGIDNCKFKK